MFRECNNAWMSARVLGQYLNENMPGKTYFYITSDYTWGHTSESSLRQATGTVDTSKHQGVRTAFPGARLSDYRAALEKAANSGAEVLVLVLFGEDMVRAMRIADELGLNKKMQIAVPNLTLSMVELAGPDIMRGVLGTEPWTWRVPELEGSERGKAFVRNFGERYQTHPPARPHRLTASSTSGRMRSAAPGPLPASRSSQPWKTTATACSRANSSGERSIIRTSRRSTPCA